MSAPTFAKRRPLPLVEVEVDTDPGHPLLNATNSYLREYLLGTCPVIVTREFGLWHLSISHPARYPTWDEVAEARYRILPPGLTFVMPLPPIGRYLNMHPNCFHLFQSSESFA